MTDSHLFVKTSPNFIESVEAVSVVHERGRGIAWRIWPGAHALLTWLESNKENWCEKPNANCHCVEIGAGVGLVGVACAGLGASHVTLTDLPEELSALERSRDSNCSVIKDRIQVAPLCFGNNEDADKVANMHAGCRLVVVGSELIYWESLFEPIAGTLSRLIHKYHAIAYIGYRIRVWKTEKRFFTKVLKQHGLECEVVGEYYAQEEDAVSQASSGHILYKDDRGDEWNTRVYKIFKAKRASAQAPTIKVFEEPTSCNFEKLNKKKPKKFVKQEKKGRAR
jgi:predicted nicotinamide N-methyase